MIWPIYVRQYHPKFEITILVGKDLETYGITRSFLKWSNIEDTLKKTYVVGSAMYIPRHVDIFYSMGNVRGCVG